MMERAAKVLRDLRADIEAAGERRRTRIASAARAENSAPDPIPVQIRQPDAAPLQVLQTIVGPLIAPLATTGIVIVFVVFMLLQREDLRDRFIRLVGTSDLHRTTQALGDAGKRVSRYLLMQLVVNTAYGIPIGIGLWLIGVPNPLLWGMLSIILRFVPYIGPIIAAAFPLALSIAVDPGWTMLLWTGALFLFLELIIGNIVEPWALRRQHRSVIDRRPCRRDLLDLALGTRRPAFVDTADRVFRGARPACAPVRFSQCPFGQRTRAGARRKPVSAPACRRSG